MTDDATSDAALDGDATEVTPDPSDAPVEDDATDATHDATHDGVRDGTTDAISGYTPTDSPICQGGVVWKPTSSRIEIRAFNFWSGVSGYLQDRQRLTAAQLAALDGLCIIPTPTNRLADGMTYRIIVSDDDGTQTSYRASQGNFLEGNEGLPTIDINTLDPFLATFKCLFSRAPSQPPPPVDGGPPWTRAPEMGTDSGCLNGVDVRQGCVPSWVKVKVDTPRQHRIDVFECTGSVPALKLFSPDGTTELAASNPAPSSLCPYIAYNFDPAGTYLMSIERPTGTACDAGFVGNPDLYLRFQP